MPQFPHEDIRLKGDVNARFDIYLSCHNFVPEHWHRSLEVLYIYEGMMEVLIGQHTYQLFAGDFMVINTAVVHATRTYETSRIQLLQIPYSFLVNAIPDYDDIQFVFSDHTAFGQIREVLLSMGTLYTQKPQGYTLRFSSLLYEFLFILVSHFKVALSSTAKIQSRKNLDRLAPVIHYVQEHYAETVSLQKAAELAALNPEYFCRFFHRNMGTTFVSYLNSVRLTHVCQDLKNTDLTIGDILEQNGVTNYKLFMRTFKQIYGCTPKDFRRQNISCPCPAFIQKSP